MKVIVLNAGKCGWGNCLFCGWGRMHASMSSTELIEKFSKEKGDDGVKLFCSGSFFDDNQFPKEFREHVAKEMQGKDLYVESRPEYLTKEKLSDFNGVKLFVAMGLEAGDDEVLKKLKKGITLEKFKKASELIHSLGFKVKGYLLVNPPFDYKGLLDKGVTFGKTYCDELVLINTYPHSASELFDHWINGSWKPTSEKEFYEATKKYKDVQLDANNYAFTPKFPEDKKSDLTGVGIKFVSHPHFNVWQDYLVRLYQKPIDKDIALFLPCSKKKPYYNSRTHQAIRRVITGFNWYKRVHIIVISNPGVIPIEFADKYPFNYYDWNESLETPEVMKEYIRINTERAKNYLQAHKYTRVLSYFKPTSESGLALETACKELKIPLVKLCDEEMLKKIHFDKNPLIHPLMIRSFKEKIAKELK